MRVRISDMGGSETRLCRLDIEDASTGQYDIRVFAIHARGVFDQNYTFTGTSFSTPPFSLPTKDLNGRIRTSISVEAFVSRIVGGFAVENNRFEMSYFLQAVETFTAAEFNAAVQANVNAVVANQVNSAVAAATASLNAQILALQQAGNGNLQPLINAGLILQPQRRVGQYTIKDFTVLNAIYRAGAPTYFIKKDLDFINVQLLSIRQAVQKMYQVAVAKDNDLNTTAIYRTRADKRKEYSAKIDDDFKEFLLESVRVMNYAVDEVRFNQKFNLPSPTLVRDLDILP
jgi:hypothetical protein